MIWCWNPSYLLFPEIISCLSNFKKWENLIFSFKDGQSMCAFISNPAQNWLFYKCDLSLLPFFLKDFLDFTSIVVVLFFYFSIQWWYSDKTVTTLKWPWKHISSKGRRIFKQYSKVSVEAFWHTWSTNSCMK